MWNRHIMFITIEHKEHRNLEIRKHVTTSCSGTKPFYYFWVKGFNIRRETQSFYAGFFIWSLSRAAPMARKFISPQRAPKVERLRSESSLNSLTFFKSPTNLCALPVRDVTHTPSPVSSWTIVTSLGDTSIHPRAPTLTPASMLHLTNPCAEPKGSQPN